MTQGFTHETTAKETPVDWYTPPHIFEALGIQFDLDPCSPANGAVTPATNHISLPRDGLHETWIGNVWMNPPYGAETKHWMKKLAQHGNGIALVFARTDTRWFQQAAVTADLICFVANRIKFINGRTGKESGTPGAGSCLIAFGASNAEALRHSGLGLCVSVDKV